MADDNSELTTLRERAYASFTKHLLDRSFRPGQFISQRELVEFTGLTLGAIRELVPRLESEGLLTTIPQRGMQIANVDITLVREVFQYRQFIERESIAIFAVKASDETIARMRKEHEEVLAAYLADPSNPEVESRAQTIDWGMHDEIVFAVGNQIVTKNYLVNSMKLRLIRQERLRIGGRIEPVMREHLKVIDALERRDTQGAVDALTAHIESARKLALQLA
jgi:DNA-binding GntR family transcriptional regulator